MSRSRSNTPDRNARAAYRVAVDGELAAVVAQLQKVRVGAVISFEWRYDEGTAVEDLFTPDGYTHWSGKVKTCDEKQLVVTYRVEDCPLLDPAATEQIFPPNLGDSTGFCRLRKFTFTNPRVTRALPGQKPAQGQDPPPAPRVDQGLQQPATDTTEEDALFASFLRASREKVARRNRLLATGATVEEVEAFEASLKRPRDAPPQQERTQQEEQQDDPKIASLIAEASRRREHKAKIMAAGFTEAEATELLANHRPRDEDGTPEGFIDSVSLVSKELISQLKDQDPKRKTDVCVGLKVVNEGNAAFECFQLYTYVSTLRAVGRLGVQSVISNWKAQLTDLFATQIGPFLSVKNKDSDQLQRIA